MFFEDVKLGISCMAISKPGVQINGYLISKPTQISTKC